MTGTLLDSNTLRNVRVSVSVSESPDLGRLGLLETHFRLALGEIDRWNRRDQPLLVCGAWSVHRRTALSDIERFASDFRLLATMVYLDPDGAEVDPTAGHDEAPVPVEDPGEQRRALTNMRHYLRRHTSARVFLGGKRRGFRGEIPGLMEEALLAVQAEQPIYLAGGFGGVTADIISALGVDDGGWLPPDASAGPLTRGGRTATRAWRPSDIAALVSLGLGRLRRDAAPG